MSNGRIVSYSFASGTSAMNATNALTVNTGIGATIIRTTTTVDFEAQLGAWKTLLDAYDGVWTLTYSTTTKRLTIACTKVFSLTLNYNVGGYLGFTASPYAGLDTYTGETGPGGVVELVGVEMGPAVDGAKVNLQQFRHGRALAIGWGNTRVHKARLWVRRSDVAALQTGYCLTGRVRIFQDNGIIIPYNPAVLTGSGGYVDAYVVATDKLRALGQLEDYLAVDMALVVSP